MRFLAVAWLRYPLVVKPRFGSRGEHVHACAGPDELGRLLGRLRGEAWFRRQGALLQELVPPAGHDLRILVAGGRVVGAVKRVAAPGEWRTNAALGRPGVRCGLSRTPATSRARRRLPSAPTSPAST